MILNDVNQHGRCTSYLNYYEGYELWRVSTEIFHAENHVLQTPLFPQSVHKKLSKLKRKPLFQEKGKNRYELRNRGRLPRKSGPSESPFLDKHHNLGLFHAVVLSALAVDWHV